MASSPLAEKAIITGNPDDLIGFILDAVRDDLIWRFYDLDRKKHYDVIMLRRGVRMVPPSPISSSMPITSTNGLQEAVGRWVITVWQEKKTGTTTRPRSNYSAP